MPFCVGVKERNDVKVSKDVNILFQTHIGARHRFQGPIVDGDLGCLLLEPIFVQMGVRSRNVLQNARVGMNLCRSCDLKNKYR